LESKSSRAVCLHPWRTDRGEWALSFLKLKHSGWTCCPPIHLVIQYLQAEKLLIAVSTQQSRRALGSLFLSSQSYANTEPLIGKHAFSFPRNWLLPLLMLLPKLERLFLYRFPLRKVQGGLLEGRLVREMPQLFSRHQGI
jgi:hypothetical protein